MIHGRLLVDYLREIFCHKARPETSVVLNVGPVISSAKKQIKFITLYKDITAVLM